MNEKYMPNNFIEESSNLYSQFSKYIEENGLESMFNLMLNAMEKMGNIAKTYNQYRHEYKSSKNIKKEINNLIVVLFAMLEYEL